MGDIGGKYDYGLAMPRQKGDDVKLLVCGTRCKREDYKAKVEAELSFASFTEIVEGCCPNSADAFAEEYCKSIGIEPLHFPANSGNYLKRNIEMVSACDKVLAFWNGFSYGTAHTIATAVLQGKPVKVVKI